MAELLKFATADSRPRSPGGFVRTETAEDILRSLHLMRSINGTAMTMIAGVPGIGKTHTLKHFCEPIGYDVIYMAVACDEGKPSGLAEVLMRFHLGSANGHSLTKARERLANLIGQGRVLVIDEAQYLTPAGAEWLRSLAETGGFDLVLCGDLRLAALVESIPQLYSRMRRPIRIASVKQADVEAVAAGTGFESPEAIKALFAVAKLRGGLRNVENVVQMAQLFAGNDRPGSAHLKAAIVDLKLDPKGVKEWA